MGVGAKFVGKRQFEIYSKNLRRKLQGTNITFVQQDEEETIVDCPPKEGILWEPLFTNGADWIWGWEAYGTRNVLLGRQAASLLDVASCTDNVIVGYQACYEDPGGGISYNVILGSRAAYKISSNGYNVVLGAEAAYDITSGYQNVIAGYKAGYKITTGRRNVFIGDYTGAYSPIGPFVGAENVAVGSAALQVIRGTAAGYPGWENTAVGAGAGYRLRDGYCNDLFGYGAGYYMRDGYGNTALGYGALAGPWEEEEPPTYYNEGNWNVAVGNNAGRYTSTGEDNVIIGPFAGYYITSGSYNILIGSDAGHDGMVGGDDITSESHNICIGRLARIKTGVSFGIAIGYNAVCDAWHKMRVGGEGGYAISIETEGQYISTKPSGTAPISVISDTVCINLNADKVDGHNVYVSDDSPSGGSDGDIWLEY